MVQALESLQLSPAALHAWPVRDLWRAWTRISGALLLRAWGALRLWMEREAQRRDLAELSPESLRDIGLTREDVRVEIAKPFWQE